MANSTDGTGDNGAADGVPTGPDRHDRARAGLDHLQAAARELIYAARALLDVAEDLVDDPDTVESIVGAIGVVGALVRQRATGGHAAGVPDGRLAPGGTDPEREPAVERIAVT